MNSIPDSLPIDVSVIIVNYNTSDLVAECVKSIIDKTEGVNYEVFVVDNNSEPDFQEKIVRKASIPYLHQFSFIGLPENIGFGRANNVALKIANGRNIFFLNPDTILLNNAIKILSDFLDSHPEAGACGGNLFDENLNPTYSFKRFLPGVFWEIDELLNALPHKLLYGRNCHFNHKEEPLSVGYISGADLMVKNEVLRETGPFRKEYFMYFEETDLCCRILRKGWKIYSVPGAEIQHLESKSFGPSQELQSDFKTRLMEESRNKYYSLNKTPIQRHLANMIYSLFLLSRRNLLRSGRKKDYYSKRLNYFRGK